MAPVLHPALMECEQRITRNPAAMSMLTQRTQTGGILFFRLCSLGLKRGQRNVDMSGFVHGART